MSYDEAPFPEPFGPFYERPPGEPCPDCECCTLRLCLLAAREDILCSLRSHDPALTDGCPCSATADARAETTRKAIRRAEHAPEERGHSEANAEDLALEREEPW